MKASDPRCGLGVSPTPGPRSKVEPHGILIRPRSHHEPSHVIQKNRSRHCWSSPASTHNEHGTMKAQAAWKKWFMQKSLRPCSGIDRRHQTFIFPEPEPKFHRNVTVKDKSNQRSALNFLDSLRLGRTVDMFLTVLYHSSLDPAPIGKPE